MTTSALPIPRARVAIPLAVVLVLMVTALIAELSEPETASVTGIIGMILGHGTASMLMFRRSASLPDAERRAWRMFAAAFGFIAVSLVVFAVSLTGEPPVFGWVDAAFLLSYGLLITALGMLARVHRSGPPWGLTMLDSAVAAVAASALIWELVLSDLGDVAATQLERVGLALYPVLDVGVIVGLCLVAIRRSGFRFDPRFLLLAGATTAQVIADILYLRDGLGADNFTDASPHFGFFIATAALAIAAAAIVDRQAEIRPLGERAQMPLWAMVWPYLLAGTLVPVHVLRVEGLLGEAASGRVEARDVTDDRVVLYALLAVGVLVLIRQTVAIRHNRKRVERQRRDLISSVSHELRTPLTAILGFLEIVQSDGDQFETEERNQMLAEAATQTRHMSRTMTDIITLARDGGASMTVRSGEISLAEIIEGAVHDEGTGLNLTTDVDDHRLTVDGDRIRQAVGHILANARLYGGKRTHVRAAVHGGLVTIEVHDDGPGIPSRHLATIWDQFDRGSRRLDSTSPGLGIGLAIVRAVARAHGGSADYMTSGLLGGACFRIVVPSKVRSGTPWLRHPANRASPGADLT